MCDAIMPFVAISYLSERSNNEEVDKTIIFKFVQIINIKSTKIINNKIFIYIYNK